MLSETKSRFSEKTLKHTFFFFLVIISAFLSEFAYKILAQNIPNGDFEEWFTCLCDPPYWNTNNIYPPPLECLQVFPSAPPYSGDYCIEGIVDTCPELANLFPPLIQSFEIPINNRPEALHGFYKYIPVGEDLFVASIQTYLNSVLIGEGILKSQQLISDFTEFIININYTTTNDIPDVAIIKFTIDSSLASNKLHQGSKCYIDYLFFGPLSDVVDEQTDIPNAFYLNQNYPNPFNPSTKIKYQIPALPTGQAGSLNPSSERSPSDKGGTLVALKLYDILGKEIATLVNEEQSAGVYEIEFDASKLSSGVYFYQLRAGEYTAVKKMLLLK